MDRMNGIDRIIGPKKSDPAAPILFILLILPDFRLQLTVDGWQPDTSHVQLTHFSLHSAPCSPCHPCEILFPRPGLEAKTTDVVGSPTYVALEGGR